MIRAETIERMVEHIDDIGMADWDDIKDGGVREFVEELVALIEAEAPGG